MRWFGSYFYNPLSDQIFSKSYAVPSRCNRMWQLYVDEAEDELEGSDDSDNENENKKMFPATVGVDRIYSSLFDYVFNLPVSPPNIHKLFSDSIPLYEGESEYPVARVRRYHYCAFCSVYRQYCLSEYKTWDPINYASKEGKTFNSKCLQAAWKTATQESDVAFCAETFKVGWTERIAAALILRCSNDLAILKLGEAPEMLLEKSDKLVSTTNPALIELDLTDSVALQLMGQYETCLQNRQSVEDCQTQILENVVDPDALDEDPLDDDD